MIGNWLSAESMRLSRSPSLPCRMKPRMDVLSSSSGKIAMNA
jgi:hypothetical protein